MHIHTHIHTHTHTHKYTQTHTDTHIHKHTHTSFPALALTSTEKLVKCVLTHDTFVSGLSSWMIPLLDHPPLLRFLCIYT